MADFFRDTGAPGPWGPFDKDAKLHFDFSVADWVALSGTGLTLVSVEFLPSTIFTIDRKVFTPDGASVRFRVQCADPTTVKKALHPFTMRMVLSDDQQDDRTFYLQVTDR